MNHLHGFLSKPFSILPDAHPCGGGDSGGGAPG